MRRRPEDADQLDRLATRARARAHNRALMLEEQSRRTIRVSRCQASRALKNGYLVKAACFRDDARALRQEWEIR